MCKNVFKRFLQPFRSKIVFGDNFPYQNWKRCSPKKVPEYVFQLIILISFMEGTHFPYARKFVVDKQKQKGKREPSNAATGHLMSVSNSFPVEPMQSLRTSVAAMQTGRSQEELSAEDEGGESHKMPVAPKSPLPL
jgi:hypothetical protein